MKKLMIALMLMGGSAMAMEVGDKVPEIKVPSTGGGEVALSDYAGDWLVVYFYPKAFTPGCTKQACSLRDGYSAIQEAGAVVLGVSLDKLDTQQKFKAEHNLPFELLADSDKELSRAMDTLMLGGLMTKRMTYVINPEGVVTRILENVDVNDHDDEVIAAIEGAGEG